MPPLPRGGPIYLSRYIQTSIRTTWRGGPVFGTDPAGTIDFYCRSFGVGVPIFDLDGPISDLVVFVLEINCKILISILSHQCDKNSCTYPAPWSLCRALIRLITIRSRSRDYARQLSCDFFVRPSTPLLVHGKTLLNLSCQFAERFTSFRAVAIGSTRIMAVDLPIMRKIDSLERHRHAAAGSNKKEG